MSVGKGMNVLTEAKLVGTFSNEAPVYLKKQEATEAAIKRKRQLLIDFGVPEEIIEQHMNVKFTTLLQLDVMAENILRKHLQDC